MSLDLGLLREIPVFQEDAEVYYRTVRIPEAGAPDPLYVQPAAGRWPTDWTLYTAMTDNVAWAEYCRNHPRDVAASDVTGGVGISPSLFESLAGLPVERALPSRALYRLKFGFTRLADLTIRWAEELLESAGFSLNSFYASRSAGYGDCPAIAALVDTLGWEAMRVPSAAWQISDGWCVPVFHRGRDRLSEIEQLEPFASPTVAIAHATTYHDGERPNWLGTEPV